MMKQGKPGYHFTNIEAQGYTLHTLVNDHHPHLGVCDMPHGNASWYTILHVPSGRAVAHCYTRGFAFAVVEALVTVEGLATFHETRDPAVEARCNEVITATRGSYGQPVARKEPPPTDSTPVRLVPVYRPGFTPSVAVRRADRELAGALGRAMAGDKTATAGEWDETLERSFQAAWEEEFMVRVPGLRRSEVPPRPRGSGVKHRLVDGTPCSYAGFQASRAVLDRIGDDLLRLSNEILDLDEGRAYWDDDDRGDWNKATWEFSNLVVEGWLEWTACVAHFCASSPAEQQAVIEELGFVGNAKSGWRELGEKTFLRHPEIRRATLVRHSR